MATLLSGNSSDMARFRERVYRLVGLIPAGRVATYGQIAALAGHPRRARHVGNVLARDHGIADLPWHRVLNAQGRVSARNGAGHTARPGRVERLQVRRLRGEGVRFKGGRVNLEAYRWRPEEGGGAFGAELDPLETDPMEFESL